MKSFFLFCLFYLIHSRSTPVCTSYFSSGYHYKNTEIKKNDNPELLFLTQSTTSFFSATKINVYRDNKPIILVLVVHDSYSYLDNVYIINLYNKANVSKIYTNIEKRLFKFGEGIHTGKIPIIYIPNLDVSDSFHGDETQSLITTIRKETQQPWDYFDYTYSPSYYSVIQDHGLCSEEKLGLFVGLGVGSCVCCVCVLICCCCCLIFSSICCGGGDKGQKQTITTTSYIPAPFTTVRTPLLNPVVIQKPHPILQPQYNYQNSGYQPVVNVNSNYQAKHSQVQSLAFTQQNNSNVPNVVNVENMDISRSNEKEKMNDDSNNPVSYLNNGTEINTTNSEYLI